MIKIVGFDIGGTLLQKKQYSLQELIDNRISVESKRIKKEIDTYLRKSKKQVSEFCDAIGYFECDKMKKIINCYQKRSVVFDETYKILKELKSQGYILVAISNAIWWHNQTLSEYGLDKYFDKEIYSYDVGFLKPEKEIFLEVYNYYDVCPSEILFIGNSLTDIVGATRVGWYCAYLCEIERQVVSNSNGKVYIVHQLHDIFEILKMSEVIGNDGS